MPLRMSVAKVSPPVVGTAMAPNGLPSAQEKWRLGPSLKRAMTDIFKSYGILLFSQDIRVGMVLFGLSFLNLSSGIHAVVVYASVRLFTRFIGLSEMEKANPFLIYNPLLVGLSVGYLYTVSPVSMVLAVSGGIFCLLLSQGLQHVLGYYFALPILNLTFSLVATLIYLAGARYGSLFLAQPVMPAYLNFESIPIWLSGLFHSLGILVFLPTDAAGILLLAMFWYISRIQFFLVVLSYYSGTLFHGLLYGNGSQAFLDPYNFNFISVGLALGGYFLIPSRRTYVLVVLAVAVSAILQDALGVFWAGHQIPVFTFPFALSTLMFLYFLKINGYSHITKIFSRTPEENLENWICNTDRFGSPAPAPCLPFNGEWTVYQGFDDIWTHQGLWKHAVDFVIADPHSGNTFRNEGAAPTDYFCFGKPVVSPVAGYVAAVEAGFPDNPVGKVDSEKNWGNYVIVKSEFGYYVELSHLKHKSVCVEVGQWVALGQLLGYCGNSGYSPQPHLHMQCQLEPFAGARTIPFAFGSAVAGTKLLGRDWVPERAVTLHSLPYSSHWVSRLNYVLDETYQYRCVLNGEAKSNLVVRVGMDVWGTQYLEDIQTKARLHFSQLSGRFNFLRYEGSHASWLKFFFTCLPSLPPTEECVEWRDALPGNILRSRSRITAFLQSLDHAWFSADGLWNLAETGMVSGSIRIKALGRTLSAQTQCHLRENRSPGYLAFHLNGNIHELYLEKT